MKSTIERKFTLQVPSSTENLAIIREFLTNIGTQAGFSEIDVSKLVLAVDEACANVMEHAYGHDADKEVFIRATFDEEMLRIDVEDTGRGFDSSAVKPAELERLMNERRSGGLGMHLMKTLMDEVRYEIGPGLKNELHMMKRINKA